MATEYYSDFLAHYGVPGQKWGVRRYQNIDGSYTAEGAMRYWGGTGQPRMRRAMPQPANTRRYGMANQAPQGTRMAQPQPRTQPQTAAAQNQNDQQVGDDYKRRELAKNLLIAAGAITLTAAAAYGAYKGYGYLRRNMDSVLKKGSSVYRVQFGTDNAFNRGAAYVSDNSKDAMKYRGLLGAQRTMEAQQVQFAKLFNPDAPELAPYKSIKDWRIHEAEGQLNKNIKVAGDRTGRKVYEYLLKNDKEFAKADANVIKSWESIPNNPMIESGKQFGSGAKADYRRFNQRLVDKSDEGQKAIKKFYDELSRRGYGAIQDVNDRDASGYNTKAKIIFNTKEITQKKVSELTDSRIGEEAQKAWTKIQAQTTRKTLAEKSGKKALRRAPIGAALVGTGAYLGGINAQIRAHRSEINAYKREHPGTQKSDKEIYEMLYKRS